MSRKLSDHPRVFCIGLHKTGTTTLGHALVKLGYSVLGCRLDMVHPLSLGNVEAPLELAGKFDALQDVPWALLYRELDSRYLDSKFILTVRDQSAWLESALRHFGAVDVPLHRWIYGEGRVAGNESRYLERYREHNDSVLQYFSSRPDDLCVMNLEQGDGWKKLCEFLGHDLPRGSFPRANQRPDRLRGAAALKHRLRTFMPMPVRRSIFQIRLGIRRLQGKPDPRNVFNNVVENRRERATWTDLGLTGESRE